MRKIDKEYFKNRLHHVREELRREIQLQEDQLLVHTEAERLLGRRILFQIDLMLNDLGDDLGDNTYDPGRTPYKMLQKLAWTKSQLKINWNNSDDKIEAIYNSIATDLARWQQYSQMGDQAVNTFAFGLLFTFLEVGSVLLVLAFVPVGVGLFFCAIFAMIISGGANYAIGAVTDADGINLAFRNPLWVMLAPVIIIAMAVLIFLFPLTLAITVSIAAALIVIPFVGMAVSPLWAKPADPVAAAIVAEWQLPVLDQAVPEDQMAEPKLGYVGGVFPDPYLYPDLATWEGDFILSPMCKDLATGKLMDYVSGGEEELADDEPIYLWRLYENQHQYAAISAGTMAGMLGQYRLMQLGSYSFDPAQPPLPDDVLCTTLSFLQQKIAQPGEVKAVVGDTKATSATSVASPVTTHGHGLFSRKGSREDLTSPLLPPHGSVNSDGNEESSLGRRKR